MGTHPIFESDFDCLTDTLKRDLRLRMPSKAKKTQNKKSTKAARRAVTAGKTLTKGTQNVDEDVKCAPKDFNEESEWEIEQFGGLYLCWGKKKVRKEDGQRQEGVAYAFRLRRRQDW